LDALERASALNSKSQRIVDNLELARTAVNEDLPQKRLGESDTEWAARLNDAGVIAKVQGNTRKLSRLSRRRWKSAASITNERQTTWRRWNAPGEPCG
jgi:hypothetical protein